MFYTVLLQRFKNADFPICIITIFNLVNVYISELTIEVLTTNIFRHKNKYMQTRHC